MIHRIINRLMQRGADVLYDAIALVHVSGHAASEEMKLMINLVRPRFFVPIHGELRHLRQHARMAQELGIPAENIAVVENGTVLELDDRSLAVGPRIPGGYVFVDGASVGEIGSSVMRDREQLAQNGFFLAVATLGRENKLIGQPEFISRGFANLDETPELLQGAVDTVARVISQFGSSQDRLSSRIEDALGRYLYAETGRRPLVYVVLR